MTSQENQCYRVHVYMKEHKYITGILAFTEIGVYRLSSCIYRLKKRGVKISDRWREVENRYGEKCRIKEYYLEDDTKGKDN